MYTPYRVIDIALRHQTPFTGNSVRAVHEINYCRHCDRNNHWYTVYSYRTIMYAECVECHHYWFNREHYSRTTSRIQHLIRFVYNLPLKAESKTKSEAKS